MPESKVTKPRVAITGFSRLFTVFKTAAKASYFQGLVPEIAVIAVSVEFFVDAILCRGDGSMLHCIDDHRRANRRQLPTCMQSLYKCTSLHIATGHQLPQFMAKSLVTLPDRTINPLHPAWLTTSPCHP